MKTPQYRIDWVIKLYKQWLSERRIAHVLSMGRRTVHKYIIKHLEQVATDKVISNIDWKEAEWKMYESQRKADSYALLMITIGLLFIAYIAVLIFR